MAQLLTQTSAQNGSTKIGLFHDLIQCPVHAVNAPHYEEKAGNEHTALLPGG
jgi:hypothetical protein